MKKHRKLFPALAATNQSADCPYFCHQTCPYSCYADSDYYNFLPPPQPPPPVLPSDHPISPLVIILLSVLACFFLLASYYIITAKSCLNWLTSSRSDRQREGERGDIEDDEDNQIEHPIWFITTAGLQQSIINSITVCRYKKGEGLIEGTECSVCLSEFQQDETLRLLPKCNHAFHIPCIDTWLSSHTNCPLCRAHIVNANNHPLTTPLPSLNQNPEDLNPVSNNQMENPEIEQANQPSENRASCREEDVNVNLGMICDTLTVRRSLSMDSLTAKTVCPIEFEGISSVDGTEIPQIAQGGKLSPVAMTRSYSCGGRIFSSRHYRN